ncbi:UPF0052-domain-containing protein [Xylona heveae TC161]|uniref:UPF0052-domain-containing protein n=1 Tax=Xylona heveae (strain CBS 132557 / TC161) TaxID=1328760 RepID=A0A165JWE2_XYLHT|nr:UPF0052-domain-containing protein [Xylona heveae TC161]KZF26707.1 UPF0052-domain-containing protein [Xylona heveae TC161]
MTVTASSSGTSTPRPSGIVVFSGGSAANSLVDVFKHLAQSKSCPLSYVIPISDNGGSSSELIRVFGGPGIGDVRSRLVRLIPSDEEEEHPNSERSAIKALFNHRLASDGPTARHEWLDIVEARHALWKNIPSSQKELIRSFLNLINLEIVKRARPSSVFDFSSASVGNLFLTGARLFSGSFESAIYLFSSISGVPSNVEVLPAINSNFSHHISAGLANGTVITGQNSISHPSVPTALSQARGDDLPISPTAEAEAQDHIEDANLPGSLPTLRKQYINFSKTEEEDLPARIERIWYINPYGQEIRPPANPRVVQALDGASCVVYSIGSLYTSIIPSLILRGVGQAIATSLTLRHKVLILNGSLDRETGPSSTPFTAMDFVAAIARAGAESRGLYGQPEPRELRRYVTHVVYVEGQGSPKVDREALLHLGIETVRIYGRKTTDGRAVRYDEKALIQALEAILGKRDARHARTRRMTVDTGS